MAEKSAIEINYEELQQALLVAGSLVGAAEVHGMQVGIVCGLPEEEYCSYDWLTVLQQELVYQKITAELKKSLEISYGQMVKQLSAFSFSFNLLLPDDEEEFNERAEALAAWCRGFLCGLASVGVTQQVAENLELVQETISDISKIAYASTAGHGHEEDEVAFTEIVEFIRVAVQLVLIEVKNYKETKKEQLAISESNATAIIN